MLANATNYDITRKNIDAAIRYATVIDAIADVYRPNSVIAEVGSGSAGVTEFLHHEVIGIDPAFERTSEKKSDLLKQICARATQLPLADGSCDIVICVDMLEHVPSDARKSCISELLRIVRRGGRCVLAFPADASAEVLDSRLNQAYQQRFGREHPWAIEHIRNGLPRTQDVVKVAREIGKENVSARIFKATSSLAWWYLIHRPYTIGTESQFGWRLNTPRVVRAMFEVARRLNFSPAYRAVIVLDKSRS